MPDWKRVVRSHLALPAWDPLEYEAVVEEVSSEMEECYLEALAHTGSEDEATSAAMELVPDWDELATSIRASRRDPIGSRADRSVERVEAEARARGGWLALLADLVQDLRYGVRQLQRRPASALVVVATLALGIGANATMFSLVKGLLFQPLPYPDSQALVTVNHRYPTHDLTTGVSAPGFRDYQARAASLDLIAIAQGWSPTLTGLGEPERIRGGRVSWAYFDTYGVGPTLGRSFRSEEDVSGGARVAVVSHGFWERRMAGRTDVLGTSVVLDGGPYEIVGVMPPGFVDYLGRGREVWVPVALAPDAFDDRFRITESYRSVARLRPGATVETAARDLAQLAETIKNELPGTYPEGWTLLVGSLEERERSGYRATLLLLFSAAGFVLLIACANTANMLLARAMDRETEVAVRRAMGAGAGRLTRQLLMESTLVSILGALAGILVALGGVPAVLRLRPDLLTMWSVEVDLGVLAFALALSLIVGVLVGWSGVSASLGLNVQASLREGARKGRAGGRRARLRQAFVVVQFALALILVTGAMLMIQSVARLRSVDPGFATENLLAATLRLPISRYPDAASTEAFFNELLPRLEAAPGVRSAALTEGLPFSGSIFTTVFNIEGFEPGSADQSPWGEVRTVSPSFATTMDMPVLRGRFLQDSDGADDLRVVVVDEEAVRRYWPDEDPIGKRLGWDPDWFTVVGVVGHMTSQTLDAAPRLQLYFSYHQTAARSVSLLVRSAKPPGTLVPTVRSAVLSVDADQPLSDVSVVEDLVAGSMGNERLVSLLLSLFAGLALLLAALGIYGVMSYEVRRRLQELGIRLTFGASPRRLVGLVLWNSLGLATTGILLGAAGSVALGRTLEAYLYGIDAVHAPTLAIVSLALLGVTAVSVALPARRATRVDPLDSLRRG